MLRAVTNVDGIEASPFVELCMRRECLGQRKFELGSVSAQFGDPKGSIIWGGVGNAGEVHEDALAVDAVFGVGADRFGQVGEEFGTTRLILHEGDVAVAALRDQSSHRIAGPVVNVPSAVLAAGADDRW